MIPADLSTLANARQARYDQYMSAAQRALLGFPQPGEESSLGKTPAATALDPVMIPPAPLVASRSMPGTTPLKTKGFV